MNALVTSTTANITVNPISPLKLALSGPATVTAGACSAAYTVTIEDPYGNTSNATSTVQVNLTGGGTGAFYTGSGCTGAVTNISIANGTSAGMFYFKDTSAQTLTLSAADNAGQLTTGTQGLVVNPAAASILIASGFANPASAGVASTLTVVAKDQYGNVATTYTGTVKITSSDSNATLPANYTYQGSDAGTHNFSVTLKTMATQSITATDTVTSTITGNQTGIVVDPGPTSIFTVAGFPTPTTAGTSGSVVVTAKDAFGNTTPAYTGTAHFTSGDTQAVLPANYTFLGSDNGAHTFASVVLKTAGNQAITATDTVTATITGAQNPIVVNPAAGKKLMLAGPTTGVTGACTAVFTVTAADSYGNAVQVSPAVQVNLSGAGSGAFYTNSGCTSATVTNVSIASGSSTQTFYTKDNTSQSLTIGVADNAGTYASTSQGLVISPSPVTHLVVSGYPSTDTAGTSNSLTVTAEDQYNNVVVGYTGTVAFTSTDGAAVLPANYTFTVGNAGTDTFPITLKTAGTQSITVTDSGNEVGGSETGHHGESGHGGDLGGEHVPDDDDGGCGAYGGGDGAGCV